MNDTYQDVRQRIESAWQQGQQRGMAGETILLAKIFFNLPEDRPEEALENLKHLVAETNDAEAHARYSQVQQELERVSLKHE